MYGSCNIMQYTVLYNYRVHGSHDIRQSIAMAAGHVTM